MGRKLISALFFLILVGFKVTGQDHFEHYGLEEGLSQNTILSIIQDRKGYLWIGTENGLNRFDGYNFTKFYPRPGDSLSLFNAEVWSLLEANDGKIWIGHSKGISFYDPEKKVFNNILVDESHIVISSFQDSKGTLWFGTSGGGLICIANNTLKISRFINEQKILPPYDKQSWTLVTNYILSISEYQDDLLIGTRGVGVFHFKDRKFVRLQPEDSDFLIRNDIWSIVNDKGRVYMGSAKGLGIFSSDSKMLEVYKSGGANSLSYDRIARLCLQKEDGLWIATYGGGLNYFDFTTKQFSHFRHDDSDPGSLSNDLSFTLLLDRNENLWVGAWTGGLSKLNKYAQKTEHYNSRDGLGNSLAGITGARDSIFAGCYSGGIFLGTPSAGGHQKEYTFKPVILKSPLQPDAVSSIYRGATNLWVGLDGGGVAYTNKNLKKKDWNYFKRIPDNPNSLNNHLISVLVEDVHKTLWVGTRGSGLKRIYTHLPYGSKGCIESYTINTTNPHSISDNTIVCIHIDKRGYLWVGTTNGLNRSEEKVNTDHLADSFLHYGSGKITALAEGDVLWVGTEAGLYKFRNDSLLTVDGLTGEYINAIIIDYDSRVWVSTNRGIFMLEKDEVIRRFTTMDGLQSNEFNVGAGFLSDNGELWFGGINGLNVFDPSALGEEGTPSEVMVTKAIVNNSTEFIEPEMIELNYTDKIIEFEFALLDFTNPAENIYSYRLEGFDKDWVATSSGKRNATYTNLDDGNYTFMVRGRNSEGVWSKDYQVAMSILPPLWRTWWAYILYGILVLTVIALVRRNIINRARLRANLDVEHFKVQKMEELDKMKSDFFANISHEFRTPLTLILSHVEELADHKIDETSALTSIKRNSHAVLNLVNQVLDLSKIDSAQLELHLSRIPIADFCRQQIQLFHSHAFQKKVGLEASYPPEDITLCLDASFLEKIINNLVFNAISYSMPHGKVEIHIDSNENRLTIIVTDNGIGIAPEHIDRIFDRFFRVSDASGGTGIGLALTHELVRLHKGVIRVNSRLGKGTTFEVTIPGAEKDYPEYSKPIQNFLDVSDSIAAPSSEKPHPLIPNLAPDGAPILLIVEDNEELRQYLKRNLNRDFEVVLAENGKDGLLKANLLVPDIVLSDWMMEGMDGKSLCHELKTMELTSHIPVVLLTAKVDIDSKVEGLEVGADDYITKPFELKELKVRLHNLIHQRRQLREKFSKEGLRNNKHVKTISVEEQFFNRLYTVLEANLSNHNFTVEFLCREMGVSRTQLHRKVTAIAGLSAGDLIRDYRLQRAADLLRQNAGNVSEIAFQVGFENLSYFTKAFKTKYQVTPSDYAQETAS